MNAITRLSEKVQVVVPEAIRDLKGWAPGLALEVVDAGGGVLLRPRRRVKTLTPSVAVARFKDIYRHQGPRVTLEEMDEAIAEGAARRAGRR
ncbi:AbrB/MazE/SpoVT family DNA-binding domain-containing protein [Sphingomonas sp. BK580]|uniref:AbrB/MazE/SpoVT family DNA-binding domain-containing protein n=1 Tax=Sphingomonas sp. BK580 TaxID=2586972 RepID=UPI001617EDA2|nr:AbrB/MazE/SpoVT family DNA-binding domain-containing protein [Sphingomonas sp. BK580]MBB3691776.1 AbrB family looped-hinge helix DNA binding protein [Sphingomonas sp. BK580]